LIHNKLLILAYFCIYNFLEVGGVVVVQNPNFKSIGFAASYK